MNCMVNIELARTFMGERLRNAESVRARNEARSFRALEDRIFGRRS